jgi:urease accessory protein
MTDRTSARRVGSIARRASVLTGSAGAAVVVAASPAGAHVGGPTAGFADGALHPLLGPDHLLAMIAVGIVAAVTVTPRASAHRVGLAVWGAPAAFLAGMLVGGTVGLVGVSFALLELTIVVSVIALGVAVAGAVRRAGAWVPLLVIAGLAHGNAHGSEAPAAATPVLYVGGFLLATATLHAAGVGAGLLLRPRPWLRTGVGAGFAAAGAVLLV